MRERQVPSLWWIGPMCTESSVSARLCVRGSMLVVFSDAVRCLLMGCPAFLFIGQGKARITMGEKRRNQGRCQGPYRPDEICKSFSKILLELNKIYIMYDFHDVLD